MRLISKPSRRPAKRYGAAAVEFAVLAPLLGMLIVGMLELGRGIIAKEALTDAARKAARTAAYPGQNYTNCVNEATDILKDNFGPTVANSANTQIVVKVAPYTGVWTAAPTTWNTASSGTDYVANASRGSIIWVKVSVRVDDIGWVFGWFMSRASTDIESENCYMVRQG
jgi:Flp pilus assembly protein TadG